jgi:DUF4097 and DUF4098 domain-containing protein YvlB
MRRLIAFAAVIAFATAMADTPDISRMNGSIRVAGQETVGDVSTLNGSITIDDEARARDVSTVNGSVRVGKRAAVRSIEAVNGEIRLGDGASAASIETVNGEITIREQARVAGNVTAVNGEIEADRGVEIDANVENVNGTIEIDGALVRGRIETVVGNVDIGPGSRIVGGIRVEKPESAHSGGWNRRKDHPPRIVIGPEAIVEGPLVFEHEVRLYVSDRATIGTVDGATPISFSGSRP